VDIDLWVLGLLPLPKSNRQSVHELPEVVLRRCHPYYFSDPNPHIPVTKDETRKAVNYPTIPANWWVM